MDRVSNGIRGFAVVLSDASRFALACAAASAVTLASPAVAQSFSQFTQLPLSDSCEVKPGNPSCTTAVIGTRNTTVLEPFVVTPTQNGYFLDGKVQVDFEGQLQVSGIQTGSFGFTPGQVLGLQAGEVGVGVTTQYVADLHLFNQFYGLEALPSSNFTVNTLDVHSIDVNFENRDFELENGSEGTFSLHSIDPTAISNNGTALSGRFASTDNGIVFGTLSGRANVLTDPGVTDISYGNWDTGMNYLSPFALALDVTQTVTTQLDETGLVTPKVAVTDGIEMNGSRITGLANGTASTDAVNMSQLDAEANARIAGDTALGNNLAAEAAARANADFQIGQRILVEENARNELATNLATEAATRAAADLSLSNQIGGLDSRIDALEGGG